MKYRIPEQRYIGRVGIELEGGWLANRGIAPYYDGSVTIANSLGQSDGCMMDHQRTTHAVTGQRVIHHCSNRRCYECNQRNRPAPPNGYAEVPAGTPEPILAGEICSQPVTVDRAIDWIINSYPDQMNNSCGMHVHISFPDQGHYGMLMGSDFRKRFRSQYEAWATEHLKDEPLFWSRWKGSNRYCLDSWIPDQQVLHSNKGNDRYTFLNFAWGCDLRGTGKRKTVENRVFPVFTDKTVAAAAVCRYLGIVEDYIENNVVVEEAVEATVIDDWDGEDVIVCA